MNEEKKRVVKDVIRGLHAGLSAEEAKNRILRDVGMISSTEIAEIEQSLVGEGVSVDEIKKFCNVHALLFESMLTPGPDVTKVNPLKVLREENRGIEKAIAGLTAAASARTPDAAREGITAGLAALRAVERHYVLKENAVFPFLEKHGFSGPSQVMWTKHNDIRAMLRSAEAGAASVKDAAGLEVFRASVLDPLITEVEGMIYKEENILFPAAMEKITPEEWARIGDSFGEMASEYKAAGAPGAAPPAGSAAILATGAVELPSGKLSLSQLEAVFNVLPVDVSFVDATDRVAYFNQTEKRIFPRSVSVIGRSVQNCHPPQSVHKVTAILDSFRRGERDRAEFWITMNGRFISIRYFAVRDPARNYLGCLEVSQDLTELRALEGERRLLQD